MEKANRPNIDEDYRDGNVFQSRLAEALKNSKGFEREAWRLVGEKKLLVHEVPAFVEARECEARARKVAPEGFGGNRRERRTLAAQARRVK